jgi:hypothetical protein
MLDVNSTQAGFPPRRHEFEPRSGHVGFVVNKVTLGAGFLRVFQFLIPPTAPHSSSPLTRGCYNRTNNGRRTKWTQCLEINTFNFLLHFMVQTRDLQSILDHGSLTAWTFFVYHPNIKWNMRILHRKTRYWSRFFSEYLISSLTINIPISHTFINAGNPQKVPPSFVLRYRSPLTAHNRHGRNKKWEDICWLGQDSSSSGRSLAMSFPTHDTTWKSSVH